MEPNQFIVVELWFSCWLSLGKRKEMKFLHTEGGAGFELRYQISQLVM